MFRLAYQQINHAGRFAHATQQPLAPFAIDTLGRLPKALVKMGIECVVEQYAKAAIRAKQPGSIWWSCMAAQAISWPNYFPHGPTNATMNTRADSF